MFFFIAEFERAAEIREIAVTVSWYVFYFQSYNGLKKSSFRLKSGQNSVEINQNQ